MVFTNFLDPDECDDLAYQLSLTGVQHPFYDNGHVLAKHYRDLIQTASQTDTLQSADQTPAAPIVLSNLIKLNGLDNCEPQIAV